jgi:hypothetical protein
MGPLHQCVPAATRGTTPSHPRIQRRTEKPCPRTLDPGACPRALDPGGVAHFANTTSAVTCACPSPGRPPRAEPGGKSLPRRRPGLLRNLAKTTSALTFACPSRVVPPPGSNPSGGAFPGGGRVCCAISQKPRPARPVPVLPRVAPPPVPNPAGGACPGGGRGCCAISQKPRLPRPVPVPLPGGAPAGVEPGERVVAQFREKRPRPLQPAPTRHSQPPSRPPSVAGPDRGGRGKPLAMVLRAKRHSALPALTVSNKNRNRKKRK